MEWVFSGDSKHQKRDISVSMLNLTEYLWKDYTLKIYCSFGELKS